MLTELLADWGAFLKLDLDEEALTWFLGGESAVKHPVMLTRGDSPLGQQPMHLLSSEVAFRLTALTDNRDRAEDHLRRFLALTPLRALQWINFHHAQIELMTLLK